MEFWKAASACCFCYGWAGFFFFSWVQYCRKKGKRDPGGPAYVMGGPCQGRWLELTALHLDSLAYICHGVFELDGVRIGRVRRM